MCLSISHCDIKYYLSGVSKNPESDHMCVLCGGGGDGYPVLKMWWLADEHAFQLLIEAFHAAAQSRDQCRQGSEGDGNWLSLWTQKQVIKNLGCITQYL